MLMMLPLPRSTMCGITAWQQKKTPSTLTRKVSRQSASANSVTAPSRQTPALLTKRSTLPSRSIADATRRWAASRLPTSATIAAPRAPCAFTSATTAAARPDSTSLTAIPQPSRASRSAIARPMPVPAPVISAVRGADDDASVGRPPRSDDPLLAQAPDFRVRIPGLAQKPLRVLARHGRGAIDGGTPRGELERKPEQAHRPRDRVIDLLDGVSCLDRRVGEGLGVRPDRRDPDPARYQEVDPL